MDEFELTGFRVLSRLHTGSHSALFRAVRETDGRPVIIKTASSVFPSASEISRFQKEFNIVSKLRSQYIISFIDILPCDRGYAVIMDDPGGVCLSEIIPESGMEPDIFLNLAVRMVRGLEEIHSSGILHKDINPSNILILPESKNILFIDFGLASYNSREIQESDAPHQLQGTLSYIAPEQTGRINRSVDYRSDYYSLGITFYQMLSGHLPFTSDDPAILVHSHLAKKIPDLREKRPDLSACLAAITEKLTAKTPAERYQSSHGILHDLSLCQQNREDFIPGQNDFSGTPSLSGELIGRDSEISVLRRLLSESKKGKSPIVLILGESGSGKTALVNELRRFDDDIHTLWMRSKCDSRATMESFRPFREALNAALILILGTPQKELNHTKHTIEAKLGSGTSVITQIMPEWEALLGKRGIPAEVSISESANRAFVAFDRLFEIIHEKWNNVVIFIDDIQWADEATLNYLNYRLSSDPLPGFFLIFARRTPSGLTEDTSLLRSDKSVMGPLPDNTEIILLNNLTEDSQNKLLASMLRTSAEFAQPLARLAESMTGGNPLYFTRFIFEIFNRGYLRFDNQENLWSWDSGRICEENISEHLFDSGSENIRNLSESTYELLKTASCFGSRFRPELLPGLVKWKPESMNESLLEAERAGIIVPLHGQDDDADYIFSLYRFSHDRFRESIYSAMNQDQREHYHLIAARYFAENFKRRNQGLTEAAYHYSQVSEKEIPDSEKKEAVSILTQSGQTMLLTGSFERALTFAEKGRNLLQTGDLQDQESAFNLELLHAAALFHNGKKNEGYESYRRVSEISRTKEQKISVIISQVRLYSSAGDLENGVAAGFHGLELLGIPLKDSEETLQEKVNEYFGILKPQVAAISESDLGSAREAADPLSLSLMTLCADLQPGAYMTGRMSLYTLLSLIMVDETLKKGISPLSSYGFVMYGVTLIIIFGDYENAYRIGKTGLALDKRFSNPSVSGKNIFSFSTFIQHWTEPISRVPESLMKAHKLSLEGGDFNFAAYAVSNRLLYSLIAGFPLSDIRSDLDYFRGFTARLNEQTARDIRKIIISLIQELTNDTPDINLNENELISGLLGMHNYTVLAYVYTAIAVRDIVMQRTESSVITKESLNIVTSARGGPLPDRGFLYYAILLARKTRSRSAAEKKQAADEIREFTNTASFKAEVCKVNLQHIYLFLLALAADLEDNIHEASTYYDEAIQAAGQCGNFFHRAVFLEEAAGYHMRYNRRKMAFCYMDDSVNDYEIWGAGGAVKRLENSFPDLRSIRIKGTESASSTGSTDLSAAIDFASIFRASREISGEIRRDELLQSMISVMMENSGADRAALILNRNGTLRIEAAGSMNNPADIISVPLEDNQDLPVRLIQYVLRSGQDVVLDNAISDQRFQDSWFRKRNVRSVLCIPVISRSETAGALYLENSLAEGVFTKNRIIILKTLVSQAAIALENAELFARLEEMNRNLEKRVQEEVNHNREKDQLMIQQIRRADISELLTTIAHQWRQPLNSIGLMVQNLGDDCISDPEGEKSVSGTVKNIMNVLGNLSQTIEFFCEFYAPEKVIDFFDVSAVIHKTVSLIDKYYSDRNIHIEIHGDDTGRIKGFSGRFSQAILNILTNAREAYERNGTGGVIRISLKKEQPGENLHIIIEDEAGGVTPEFQSKLFEPYFTTKSVQAHGFGLGLYTSRIIIENTMSGKISVKNSGKGLIFDIVFPDTILTAQSPEDPKDRL